MIFLFTDHTRRVAILLFECNNNSSQYCSAKPKGSICLLTSKQLLPFGFVEQNTCIKNLLKKEIGLNSTLSDIGTRDLQPADSPSFTSGEM